MQVLLTWDGRPLCCVWMSVNKHGMQTATQRSVAQAVCGAGL